MAYQKPFDFIEDVARPLPVQVMALLLGIDQPDDDFIAWSEDLDNFIGEPQSAREQARQAKASLLGMSSYLDGLLALKPTTPGDEQVRRLAAAQARGEIEGGAELLAQCAMLLFAVHETIRHLLVHPTRWQRLVREPALLPDAVRELLRFEKPRANTPGSAWRPIWCLHDHQLRRDDLALAMIGAASQSPDTVRCLDPDRLGITRSQSSSLAFGSGLHVCTGR